MQAMARYYTRQLSHIIHFRNCYLENVIRPVLCGIHGITVIYLYGMFKLRLRAILY